MTTPYNPSQAIPTGSSVPVDPTGALDVWNLPSWLKSYERQTDKTPFFTGTAQQTVPGSPSYSQGEHSGQYNGGNQNLSPGEHSGSYNGPPSTTETVAKYSSAEDIMKNFAAMAMTDPAQFTQIQRLLLAGGWYGSTGVRVEYGMTRQTEDALGQAMIQYLKTAHGAGIPVKFEDFLSSYAENNSILNGNIPGQTGSGTGTGTGAATPIALTDPDTLARYAQMAAQNALGRALKPDELNRFVNEFHSQQLAAGEGKLDVKGTGGAFGVVDRADARSAAVGFVQENNKPEFAQHQIQGYTDAFLNMFLPNQSAAPNVAVDPSAIGY